MKHGETTETLSQHGLQRQDGCSDIGMDIMLNNLIYEYQRGAYEG